MSTERLKDIIEESNNIVFFGGAGVSTESLIPDFRSDTGLYKSSDNHYYSPEEMLNHSFLINHREDFFRFYKSKMIYKNAQPNKAHFALTDLERRGKLKAIITQNIDGLHQMAGSNNVIELHGSVHRNYCVKCGSTFNLQYILDSKELIPECKHCGNFVRPDVVLYEESLSEEVLKNAIYYISEAEVLIVGGTSLVVYPAAGLIKYFKGKSLILINKTATQYDSIADLVLNDNICKVLEPFIK
jgi:NAD-dependent protein deacetylases, SIR2 family